jgi:hypothetical protein
MVAKGISPRGNPAPATDKLPEGRIVLVKTDQISAAAFLRESLFGQSVPEKLATCGRAALARKF